MTLSIVTDSGFTVHPISKLIATQVLIIFLRKFKA